MKMAIILDEGRVQTEHGTLGLKSFKCELESGFKTLVFNCPVDLKIGDKINVQIFNKREATSRCGLVADFEFVEKL